MNVDVRCVTVDELTARYAVVLENMDQSFCLPINIGFPEAKTIHSLLNGLSNNLAQTYSLIEDLIMNMPNASIKSVTIDDEVDGTYFAKITVQVNSREEQIDCRPSDGILLSLTMDVPILVGKNILERGNA